MVGKFKLFRSILILLNAGIIISYLITCLSPFVNTGEDWYLAFPGLVFPLLFFALVAFIIIWFFLKSRWWVISLIVLLLGFQQISAAFAFHIPKKFSSEKKPNTIRVLQWNVSGWDEHDNKFNGDGYRRQMMDLVKQQNADVLCFEEFFDPITSHRFEPNIATLINMGYAYHYFVATEYYKNDFESGVAIFSRYPVVDSSSVSFEKGSTAEHLLYTDINVENKIFRIFATHLQSVHFQQKEYESISNIKHAHESGFSDSRTIISKLKKGYISRYKQAELVSEKIKGSPYQSLICGDFNDVPNSSTYFKIKGNLQDAFLQKGFFIGRTFRFISPTLRIDYILADKKFKVAQFRRIKVPYSDHYAIEADLEY